MDRSLLDDRSRPWRVVLVAVVLAATVLIQTGLFHASTSFTFDERITLTCGLAAYRQGSFDVFIRPMIPPLPVLLASWPAALVAGPADLTDQSAPRLIRLVRASYAALVGVPLVLVVFAWLWRRRGLAAATLGGVLMAFSPTILAHAAVATRDACFALFSLISLAAIDCYQRSPSRSRLVMMGLAFGLAMASKESAVFLFPLALLALAPAAWTRAGDGSLRRKLVTGSTRLVIALITVGGLAFLIWWTLYGFAIKPLLRPGIDHVALNRIFGTGSEAQALRRFAEQVPLPVPAVTFLGQVGHGLQGHPAFLMGERSEFGWWYYFPLAYLFKSTPVELFLTLVLLILAFRRSTWRDPATRLWLLAFGLYFGLTLPAKINIGHRYLIILYPLLFLCTIDAVARAAERHRRRFLMVGFALAAMQAASAVSIAPDYLSYFNRFIGGPSQGYRYLVDSNLDWGQDLPALRNWLAGRRVALAYFGTASPAAYGIDAVPWDSADQPAIDGCDWLAVSATHLQGVYEGVYVHGDPFAPFLRLTPDARAGYGTFLYDLRKPAVRAAFNAARATNGVKQAGEKAEAP